jgi:hypothetical protein
MATGIESTDVRGQAVVSPGSQDPANKGFQRELELANEAANEGERASTANAIKHGDHAYACLNEACAGKAEGKAFDDAYDGALNALADGWHSAADRKSKRSALPKRIKMGVLAGIIPELGQLPLFHAERLAAEVCDWDKPTISCTGRHDLLGPARLLVLRYLKDTDALANRKKWRDAIDLDVRKRRPASELKREAEALEAQHRQRAQSARDAARQEIAEGCSEERLSELTTAYPDLDPTYLDDHVVAGFVAQLTPLLATMTIATRDALSDAFVDAMESVYDASAG